MSGDDVLCVTYCFGSQRLAAGWVDDGRLL